MQALAAARRLTAPMPEDTGWPSSVSPDLRAIAERVLTEKELEVMRLVAWGWGQRRIASLLGITRDAVRDRAHRAKTKMLRELERLAAAE